MKFIPEKTEKSKWKRAIEKVKSIKNIEIVIAAVLSLIALISFFAITLTHKSDRSVSTVSAQMTEEENRVASIISQMEGIGKSRVYIRYDKDRAVTGVIVVADGAKTADQRVKIIRCVEIATGASVDTIQIYQMENGG